MAAGNASVFVHVEIVHPDPDAAARFMSETIGAVQVERQISGTIEKIADGMRVIHMQAGGVVFQIIRPVPIPGLNSWYEHLQEHGPSVHNVTLMMDGLDGVKDRMLERGGTTDADLDMDVSAMGLGIEAPARPT